MAKKKEAVQADPPLDTGYAKSLVTAARWPLAYMIAWQLHQKGWTEASWQKFVFIDDGLRYEGDPIKLSILNYLRDLDRGTVSISAPDMEPMTELVLKEFT